jgi:hypothetical protein
MLARILRVVLADLEDETVADAVALDGFARWAGGLRTYLSEVACIPPTDSSTAVAEEVAA